MENLISELDFCVFDLETTGFSPDKGAEIIEIGAVRIEAGEIADKFESFIQPRGRISAQISRLTGIFEEHVKEAPAVEETLAEFLDFAGNAVLIAHNASFDLSFLKSYAPRPVSNPHIDSLKMARKLYNFRSNSLENLAVEFGFYPEDAHRALADAETTAKIFLEMIQKLETVRDCEKCGIPLQLLSNY